MSANGLVAGVDVGGTFTDIVLFDAASGALTVTKVPSTPANQSEGVIRGLESVLDRLDALGRLVHGTTVSTNTILQRSGADVAMVTSEGFGDVLEIGRTRRMLPSLYDPTFVRPPPLVPRPRRFEVAERRAADGSMLVPLDEERLVGIAERIRASGAEAVAVCFLHAWADPGNEVRARDVLAQRLPGTWFTTSSEVVPEFREYERFSTTVINAYLLPVIDRYVKALGTRLDRAGYRGPVLTMSSAGGVMDLDTARTLPVRTILSGPAGGVAGATWIAGSVALEDFITCDMGGTSTDVCLIESGRPAKSTESAFMGYPIKGRQIDINTVGAGGGSIAYVEGGSVLKVGPRSAGADPGPACYGKGGTEPTVTDANVVLGRVGHRPLGGAIRLDPERARVAVADLATRLGIPDVETMAEGIVRLVVAEMANAIREISIERGYDPARFTLVPFGGAGPMHATQIAAELGMRRVLVPLDPGNLSALGLLVSDQRREHVRTFLASLANLDLDAIVSALGEQERAGREEMQASGEEVLEVRFAHALDMRYARQGFELTVDLAGAPSEPDDVRRAFLEAYARQYGHAHASGDIEIGQRQSPNHGDRGDPQAAGAPAPARRQDGGRHPSLARHGRGREVHSGLGLRARAPPGGRGVRGARRHRGGGSDHGDAARMAGAPRRPRKPAFRGGGRGRGTRGAVERRVEAGALDEMFSPMIADRMATQARGG